MYLRITLTCDLDVLIPATAPPIGTSNAGNSTKLRSVVSFRMKNWTLSALKTSIVNSSAQLLLLLAPLATLLLLLPPPLTFGLSSCSETIELREAAPTPKGKWNRWLTRWERIVRAARRTGQCSTSSDSGIPLDDEGTDS